MKCASNYFKRAWIKFNIGIPMFAMMLLTTIPNVVLLYVMLFTKYWILPLLYVIWIITVERDICERGGRSQPILRKYLGLKQFHSYFPIDVEKESSFNLDPERNYLFCCFPHGLVSFAVGGLFMTSNGKFDELFPKHSYRVATLKSMFYVPFYREFLLETGSCSVSEKSLDYVLSHPGGGKVVAIVVGGAEESIYSCLNDYHIILNKRKGFIRVALKNGSPLVPMFSFGVNDSYKQFTNPYAKRLQHWIKSKTGVAPIFFNGCGIFQNWFGLVPLPKPINTIIGEPIEVPKVDNPTREQIDDLHAQFKNKLTQLFNTYKYKYVSDSANVNLVIH